MEKSHFRLINQILKDITKRKRTSISTAEESYETNTLIHAMYSSHEQKKAIKLNTNPVSKRLGRYWTINFQAKTYLLKIQNQSFH